MALFIHSSNRIEVLQARLAQTLAALPLQPLASEVIVVPTYAMERWLRVQFARQHGVTANTHYPLATQWLWRTAAVLNGDASGEDAFCAEALAWRSFALLPELVSEPAFAALARYLETDSDGVKRWQLTQNIGQVFERYQIFRGPMIEGWTAGEGSHWQAHLWRRLVAGARQNNRVETISRAITRLDDDLCRPSLPPRISLFGLSSLPAIAIEFIHALAQRIDITLYCHAPTDQYWADLVNQRQLARQRLENPDRARLLDTGNRLLSSWGRQGQALQDLLLDLGQVTHAEVDAYRAPAEGSLLQNLQRRIFELDESPLAWPVDDSLSVHVCHSPARECQVLKDFLLDQLDRDPTLRGEDILVMVPQISRYAAYIEAAFESGDRQASNPLPWNLSDVAIGEGNPLVSAFIQLLRLPRSRFSRSEMLAFVDCEAIRLRFDLDAAMVEQVRRLLDTAKVYWGIDAAHRSEIGLPAIAQNSWRHAWDRLFGGYALGDIPLWRDIAPIDAMDASAGIALARFRYLFDRLDYWRRELDRPADAGTWQQRLTRLVDDFFGASDSEDDDAAPLRRAIAALDAALDAATDVAITPALIEYWLGQQLKSTPRPGRLYSGGITFCGMRPMRNIPFRIICLLGMQDTDFPRREQRPEFDLMVEHWRPGDPVSADEDRYLMLETLLCTRHKLYFSYCGRSLRDNSECQPSPLLRELLDSIDASAVIDAALPPVSERLTTLHPMQPFSPHNFNGAFRGFDAYWHAAATRFLADPPAASTEWPKSPVDAAEITQPAIELSKLEDFLQHPIRYFYRDRLGIRLSDDEAAEDEEPFTLSALQKWQIIQNLANARLDGEITTLEHLLAAGDLPHGVAGQVALGRIETEAETLFGELEAYDALHPSALTIDIPLDDESRLVGEIAHYYPGRGLLRLSASKSLGPRQLMGLWVNHLAICAADLLGAEESSLQLAPTARAGGRYRPLPADEARELLRDLVAFYRQGIRSPLPLLPKTGLAWARQAIGARSAEKPESVWHGTSFPDAPPGESEDAYIRVALHGYHGEPLTDRLLRDTALGFFTAALTRLEANG